MTDFFKLPDIQLLDPVVELQRKRDALKASIEQRKNDIQETLRKLAELQRLKSEFQDAINEELFQLRQTERELLLQEQKREQERLAQAELEQLAEIDEEIRKLCEGFATYEMAHKYQIEDVIYSIKAFKEGRGGFLNANKVGMGKTLESGIGLYVLQRLLTEKLGRKPKMLWLTKKSLVLKESTKKELLKWNPDWKIVQPVVNGTADQREMMVKVVQTTDMADLMIANYEFVRTTDLARNSKWDVVIIDEVHKLKGGANTSGPTAIWTAVKDMCIRAEYVLMLSGTPMVNAPEEMWSYLHIFNPTKFPTLKKFRNDFMEYKTVANEFKLVVDANKILNNVLKGQMIARTPAEVGLQIPQLNYQIIELERTPQQDAAYQQMKNNFFVWLDDQQDKPLTAMAIIAQLTRLRQINVWPSGIKFKEQRTTADGSTYETESVLDIRESSKIDEAMDIIENVDEQIVIFSTFNEPMFEIQRRCKEIGKRCEIIAGGIKQDVDVEAEFQQGNIDVLCLNSAMGEGLNLQKNPQYWPGGASYGIFLDLWWSPARNEQCIGRIHRQGSEIPVFIYELQNIPSVDQFIKSKVEEKNNQFSSIMDAKEIRPASDWKALFKDL